MIKFHFLLVLAQILCVMTLRPFSYRNYRVYEVTEDARYAPMWRKSEYGDGPTVLMTKRLGTHRDSTRVVRSYLVPRYEEYEFVDDLRSSGANYTIKVSDLGKLIEEEKHSTDNSKRRSGSAPSHTDTYFSYDEIINQVKALSKKNHPQSQQPLAIVETIGKTYENRNMYIVKISSNHSAMKPIALFEAGMHAREWLAPATALHMIYELVDNYTANQHALKNVDYYIIPVSNPDGYEYSRTTDRLWRKTRSVYRSAYGTDGNRNFDFHWGEHGSSDDPASETFGGPKPFSEPETRNIRDVGIKYKNRLILFLSIHAYGALFVYPWSYARTVKEAPYTREMENAASAAAKAIKSFSGTEYTVGNSAKLMYDSPGGSDDYFKGALGVEMSLTIELSADKEGSFIVPAKKIKKIVTEAFEGIKTLSEESYNFHKTHKRSSKRRHGW